MGKQFKPKVCHLCGRLIFSQKELGVEHVPPKQFFPSELRSRLNPNLITVPAHISCNTSFQKDEDYFISTLGLLSENADVHKYILTDLKIKLSRQESQSFLHNILNEFNPELWLPNERIMKNVDRVRVNRIAWKIVRGLHFYEYDSVLSSDITPHIGFYQGFGIDQIPEYYKYACNGTEVIGIHKGIFCYRHNIFSIIENHQTWEFWSLMFWDSVIVTVVFRIHNFRNYT